MKRGKTSKGNTSSQSAVRANVVKKAKRLVADPNYPSDQVLQAVARTLARKWAPAQRSRKASS